MKDEEQNQDRKIPPEEPRSFPHPSALRPHPSLHSGLAPDALTTGPHFLISSRRRLSNASGDNGIGCRPCVPNCSLMPGDSRIFTTSRLSMPSTFFGVPAVPHIPYQPLLSWPGTPASLTVGVSGNSGKRFADV